MFKLNRDILYLIFKELQDDKKTLFSCLMINKTWCEMVIPLLWKNPWIYHPAGVLDTELYGVIISHLSEDSKNKLEIQGVVERPLVNYINYCKHLNLRCLNNVINTFYEESSLNIIKKEIFSLFINENTRLTHLYIPDQFDYQIHLIPGAKLCFSELEFLSCYTYINDNVLNGLTEMCKTINGLELFIERENNNYKIVKLIEDIKELFNVRLIYNGYIKNDEPIKPFWRSLENSLVKHANSIRYFKITRQPITKIISSFVNLNKLELSNIDYTAWNCLENLSLPLLQYLKARSIPIKPLESLIKNSNGYLTEVKIDDVYDRINNKSIIQAIYQKCPNLKYVKLLIFNNDILELENLLIKCQYLNRLHIIIQNGRFFDDIYDWNYLFEVLTRSSPISLFNFKFSFTEAPKLESLKLFFDNWKNRHDMILKTVQFYNYIRPTYPMNNEYLDLIEKYKAQGIVKKYTHFDI
jgi:hypothetical protein